jgi:hypothetical protein
MMGERIYDEQSQDDRPERELHLPIQPGCGLQFHLTLQISTVRGAATKIALLARVATINVLPSLKSNKLS